MTKKNFSEAMNQVGDKYVNESIEYKVTKGKSKTKPWIKIGALAACMALLVIGAIPTINYLNNQGSGDIHGGVGGGIIEPGGDSSDLEGIDPIIASLAVFPPHENIRDVEAATITSISEEKASETEKIGAYLPSQLPDGFYFKHASLYETTMKNGTKYYMLRITYTSYNDTYSTDGSDFVIQVYDHKIKTDKIIYDSKDLPAFVEERTDNSTFHVSYGDVYIGISPISLTNDEILVVLNSIAQTAQ